MGRDTRAAHSSPPGAHTGYRLLAFGGIGPTPLSELWRYEHGKLPPRVRSHAVAPVMVLTPVRARRRARHKHGLSSPRGPGCGGL